MTVKTAKIKIDVEVNAEGAARGFDKLAGSTDKSKKAVDRLSPALKSARLEYQVAQARAENLAATQAKLTAKTNDATRAFERAAAAQAKGNAVSAASSSSWGGLAAGMGKVAGAAGLVTAAGIGAASMASDLAKESIAVQGVFANLPFSLKPAETATRGLADSMTLARLSIMANQSGVATTAQSYAELAGMAQTLAFKMGRDVNDTIERVTMGIAKQEREILDELVILPRMEEMWRQHAKTLGKTTAQLTDHEKTTAFTTSAIEALRKATHGVEIDMDGAAASIARTTVQVKNLKTAALGGVEASVSLRDGVAGLDLKVLAQVKNLGTYRSSFYELSDALEQAGVDTEKYRDNAVGLERDIVKVIKADARRIVDLAEEGKLTADLVDDIDRLRLIKGSLTETDERLIYNDLKRLDLENERERVAGRAAASEVMQRNERIGEIEEQLAFGRAAQISQTEINALVAEEAELRALVLEAEGKSVEAGELRRKTFLDSLAAAGESSRPKRGGGGRDRSADRARERQEQAERMRSTWEQQQVLSNAIRQKRADDAELLRTAAGQDLEIQLAQVIDFEERRAQATLAGRLREIEMQRAAGVEPLGLIQLELDARLQAIAAEEEATRLRAEREIERANAEGDFIGAEQARAEEHLALLDKQEERESALHDAAMARAEERMRIEAEVHDRRVGIAQESMDLAMGAAQAIVQGAVIEGKALRGVVAATAKGEAMRHGLILGPSALAAAAFNFAIGNIPQGTALLTAAGQSFAFAAAMGALGAATGAFGGGGDRGKSVEGFGASAFGRGPAANEPRSASGGGWDIGGNTPLSQETRSKVSSSAWSSSGPSPGPAVQQTIVVHATGQMDDMTIRKIAQGLERTGARQGRLAAGGRF